MNLSLRELAEMARGADEAEWARTRAAAEVGWRIYHKEPLPARVCNPYHKPARKQKVDSPENKERMQQLLAAMHAQYGRKN